MKEAILGLIIAAGLGGFFHFVSLDGWGGHFTIVRKSSFSVSNIFISVNDVIKWNNNRDLSKARSDDSQLNHLDRELVNNNYIKIDTYDTSKQVTPEQFVYYLNDFKSAILDGDNTAHNKLIQFNAEYIDIKSSSGNPYIRVWVGSLEEGTRDVWSVFFNSDFNDSMRVLRAGDRVQIKCRISELGACALIQPFIDLHPRLHR